MDQQKMKFTELTLRDNCDWSDQTKLKRTSHQSLQLQQYEEEEEPWRIDEFWVKQRSEVNISSKIQTWELGFRSLPEQTKWAPRKIEKRARTTKTGATRA